MNNERSYCKLCLKDVPSSDSEDLEESLLKKLTFILIDLNKSIQQSSIVCKSCKKIISNACDFKAMVLTEKQLEANSKGINSRSSSEEMLITENFESELNEKLQCNLCKKMISKLSITSFSQILRDNGVYEVFKGHIPEIDLEVREHTVWCMDCRQCLSNFSMLISLWRKTSKWNCGSDDEDFEDHFIEEKLNTVEATEELSDECVPDPNIFDKKMGPVVRIENQTDYSTDNEMVDGIIQDNLNLKEHTANSTISEIKEEAEINVSDGQFTDEETEHMSKTSTQSGGKTIDETDESTNVSPSSFKPKCLQVILRRFEPDLKNSSLDLTRNSTNYHSNGRTVESSENDIDEARTYVSQKEISRQIFIFDRDNNIVNKCSYCSYKSRNKENFNAHLQNHYNAILPTEKNPQKREYQCKHCSYKTFVRNHFERHSIRHAADIQTYKCHLCGYQTKFKKDFDYHMKRHAEREVFCCYNCSYKTCSKLFLIQHMVLHRKNYKNCETNYYECDRCLYKTEHMSRFVRHLILTHKDTNAVTYTCNICDYSSKEKFSLKVHALSHKKSTTLKKCSHCSYQTYDLYNFGKHVKSHKSILICDLCDYSTTWSSELSRHVKRNHKTKLKNQQETELVLFCFNCSYTSLNKNCLASHMKIHKRPPRISKCQFCEYQTKDERYFREHLLKHDNCDEFGMHNCTQCEFKTKYKKILNRHVECHNKRVNNVIKCEYCSKVVRSRSKLKHHMLVHKTKEELRMFKCQYCKHTTKYEPNLKIHVKLKHPNKLKTNYS